MCEAISLYDRHGEGRAPTMMAQSGETDEVAYVISIIEAVSPTGFYGALLDAPPQGML